MLGPIARSTFNIFSTFSSLESPTASQTLRSSKSVKTTPNANQKQVGLWSAFPRSQTRLGHLDLNK